MPQSKPPKDYLTAGEIKKMLGITDGMLYNFIDNGALDRVIPPGRKQGVYRRSQVEQLARELQLFVATRKTIRSVFSRATKEDVPACANISQAIFNAHFDVEKQRAWMDKNPDICYVVKNEDNAVVGYVLILPLKPEKIEKILREEESSLDLETKDIDTFDPGKPVHLYMASIAITPGITLTEKRIYASRLIAGLMNVLINLGRQGIILETMTARSDTADGIRLMRGIGFTEIPSITRRKNYLIEVEKSGIKEIMQYKQALRESGIADAFSSDVPLLPRANQEALKGAREGDGHRAKADSRTDSRTGEFSLTKTNVSEQNGAKRASRKRSKTLQ